MNENKNFELNDNELEQVSGGYISCGNAEANLKNELCSKCNEMTMEPDPRVFSIKRGVSYGVQFTCSKCGYSYMRFIPGDELYEAAIQEHLNNFLNR